MPAHDPVIFVHSEYDRACGILPIPLAVQSIADLGYHVAALVDEGTLKGVPEFLVECRNRQISPLVGMTVPINLESGLSTAQSRDIFDLNEAQTSRGNRGPLVEKVVLLALDREGYSHLLSIKASLDSSEDHSISPEQLLALQNGLLLVVGPPDSNWYGSGLFDLPRESARILSRLIRSWAPDSIAYGGLLLQGSEGLIGKQVAQLASLSLPVHPIACAWFYYRTESDRFWGTAAALVRGARPPQGSLLRGKVPRSEKNVRQLQGMTHAFRAVDRLVSCGFEPIGRHGLGFPHYPVPRGTDISSLLWTIAQETAIQTGHIHVEGGKERLVEEFQFLKQTRLPTLWMILWDIRRKIGLPPGTLRPHSNWIGSSLFAHLFGFTRIDPLRERIPFQPHATEAVGFRGGIIDIDCPQEWDDQIFACARSLLGEDHCGWCETDRLDSSQLLQAAGNIQRSWEDFEFAGDPPSAILRIPSFVSASEISNERTQPGVLLLSEANLKLHLAKGRSGSSSLDFDETDCALMGALGLCFNVSDKQTLITSPCYREPVGSSRSEAKFESISHWIENHRGEKFLGKGYADDTGRLDVVGLCSSWLRLATLPGSAGYRPLLWKWIHETAPRSLGELADLLALQWHSSFWAPTEWKRECLSSRAHPLKSEGGNPPWWRDWQTFIEDVSLPPRMAGDLGAALEKVTSSTGGWLLYQEQLDAFLASGFHLSGSIGHKWLESDIPFGNYPSEEGESIITAPVYRKRFIQFLGNPFPLPSRMENMFKAECILGLADAFADDPCAFVCLCSFLYRDWLIERKDLYAFLSNRGYSLSPPRLQYGGRFDHSPTPDSLTLGSCGILGIGMHLADDLEHLLPPGSHTPSIRSLFRSAEADFPHDFQTWLGGWKENRLSWPLLKDLILLGYFEKFHHKRGQLLEEASEFRQRNFVSIKPVQESLFSLLEPEPNGLSEIEDSSSEPSTGGSLQRLPLPEDPFTAFDSWFALSRREREEKLNNRRSILMGWMVEADLFLSSASQGEQPAVCWSTGLFFTGNQAFRLMDTKGLLTPFLMERLNEPPRLDGHRIHLRDPLVILVAAAPLPQPTGHFVERFQLEAVETVQDIQQQAMSWGCLRIDVHEGTQQVLQWLPTLLETFAANDGGVPVRIQSSAGFLKRSNVTRLIQRIGTSRVVPSSILTHSIEKIPGIGSIEIDQPSNQLLF